PGVAINSFTQAQIDAGQVVYVHNGSFTVSDTFTFTVSDGAGGNIGATTFGITVTPVNTVPTLSTNTGSTVTQGSSDVITSSELQVTDLDNQPAQLVYTVTTAPLNGHLELTTAPGVAITTFTQADINAGRLLFVHSGAVSTSDSFTFTVSDGAGGTIGATTFTVSVSQFGLPPPPPPPPPPPDPGPGPGPGPGPSPGIVPGVVTSPVLQPPRVRIEEEGRLDEPVKKAAMPSRTFARAGQPDVTLQEPMPLWLEPLALPVKKMLAVGRKLAESLNRLADDLDRAMEEREHKAHLMGRVASFTGITLSAGFVAWLLRSGSLLASFLVSMPAWRHFDPLPVLGAGGRDRKELDRKARQEQEREVKAFRGLDRVLKPSAPGAKPPKDKQGRTRRPK
ncbi:MAG: cadherin-like domain-containing protein, partial [Nitrospiraceae bacterium]